MKYAIAFRYYNNRINEVIPTVIQFNVTGGKFGVPIATINLNHLNIDSVSKINHQTEFFFLISILVYIVNFYFSQESIKL